jgi:hypothetical protein
MLANFRSKSRIESEGCRRQSPGILAMTEEQVFLAALELADAADRAAYLEKA